MLNIKYETWTTVCNAYRKLGDRVKSASLQWFPFTKLSDENWNYLSSESFYKTYIKYGSFVLYQSVMYRTENYIQKSDGSFRDASLVSPVLYLVLQSIGSEIAEVYTSERNCNISAYYSGNYIKNIFRYKQEYDDFFKEINSYQDSYQYYIKTDITNFFSNISIDKLINRIDTVCNKEYVKFTQTQLQLVKELLIYSGAGRFPLIENSVMSSYLATIVYLDEIDKKLSVYIDEKTTYIQGFRMIRYVDDLYILFNSSESFENVKSAYNEIRNEYSSILKEWGLALNSKKCKLGFTLEINQELKKSLYDEIYCGKKHNIEELYGGALKTFLKELLNILNNDCPNIEQYNALIEEQFSFDDIEFTPAEVFNYFVYESEDEAKSYEVSQLLLNIVKKDISVISLDPKRLGVLIMKTHNDTAIKATLNELFIRYRKEKWNSYHTTIAIAYLLQSEFRHIDLLSVLKKNVPDLYNYYYNNCKTEFLTSFSFWGEKIPNYLTNIIDSDWKASYLYFMYLSEASKNNNLTAYAYFKTFFDRITADLDYYLKCKSGEKVKKPNYKGFYKEKVIKDFFKDVVGSDVIIEDAFELRNGNPVAHSSAEIIENNSTKEIYCVIEGLKSIIRRFIILKKIF